MSSKVLSISAALLLSTGIASAEVPKVSADIAPVHSLVSKVMNGLGKPHLIIPAEASPHEYQLRPSDAEAIQESKLIFWIGEDLTPWLTKSLSTLPKDAAITTLLDADGIELLDFREGALFEAHDHSDHSDHDDHDDHDKHKKKDDHDDHDDHDHDKHKKKDDHDDHDDHNHGKHKKKDDHDDHGSHKAGGHAFEWAGMFELSAGSYKWSFAKVNGEYADPAMKMVILESKSIESSEETAEKLLESNNSQNKSHDDLLVVSDKAYTLNFDEGRDVTTFIVEIEKDGNYTFFTEHMPFEFEADEHFFKDIAGIDVEPVSQEPESGHHDHHEDHAGHEGHGHGEHDPHAWLSPGVAKVWLNVIAAKLSEKDPSNASTYFSNASSAAKDLDALSDEINNILDPVRDEKFVVFHDAYQYFEKHFNISASGAISLGDASDPSPARVKEIKDRVEKEDIHCVLAEPQYKVGLVKAVIEGTHANMAVIDPLGVGLEVGPTLYDKLIRNLATNLSNCF